MRKHRTVNDRTRAFTLVEILIVIIIIAILAGILLIVMESSTKSAKAAACAGNVRTLKSGLIIQMVGNPTKSLGSCIQGALFGFPRAVQVSSGDSSAIYDGICPDIGRYIIASKDKGTAVDIYCTEHSGEYGDEVAKAIVDAIANLKETKKYFDASVSGRKDAGKTLDSTGPNFGPAVIAEISALLKTDMDGQSFAVERATAWASGNEYDFNVYYTTDGSDITKGSVGDTYTVYKYNTTTKSIEKGTVKLTSKTTKDADGVNRTYNVFDLKTYTK